MICLQRNESWAQPDTRERMVDKKPVLVFDVVETLLDTNILSPLLERIFSDPAALRTWLDNLFVYSQALTITGHYANSGSVGLAVLQMMAASRGLRIGDGDIDAFRAASAAMPAYADVAPALQALRRLGYRLVTLSNSPNAASEAQLRHAGIRDDFERLFSIDDAVRRFKPARETYIEVATALGTTPADLWLVSCHAFDVMGARSAGLRAIFVSRAGNAPFALGPQADVAIPDLSALPQALAEHGT